VYFDEMGREQRARGRAVVVSCTAIESARLLLNSKSVLFPDGVANHSGLVGRNLTFSNSSSAIGRFSIPKNREARPWVASREPFVHRCVQDLYSNPAPQCPKGGTISFTSMHPNPILTSVRQALANRDHVTWGLALKNRLRENLRDSFNLRFETFVEFIPTPKTHVTIDPEQVDKWDISAARITIEHHPLDKVAREAVHAKGLEILKALEPTEMEGEVAGSGDDLMLQHGTCRFGNDPRTSVLDRNCRSHEVPNLLVVDGSFMPSCGGVPPTLTIMANSFRAGEALARAFRRGEIPS
jgi:choline dehydrogenase-like flavoprotein